MTTTFLSPSGAGLSQLDGLLQARHARSTDQRPHAAQTNGDGVVTLLCASGRGGSGTSLVSALLAFAAAGDGFRVLLVDADEHVGPLSMMLGIHARATWQDLRGGRVSPFDVATRISTTLTVVAGGAPMLASTPQMTAPLSAAERRACMRRVSTVAQGMDLVVIDCGSRFESISAAITPHSHERLIAVSAGTDPIGLAASYALCKVVHSRHSALPLDVLVNRYDGSEAQRCFDAIDAGARQFLGNALRYAGAVPTDSTLDAALRAGMPFLDAAAGSPAAIAAHDVVMRTLAGTSSTRPGA